MAKHNIIVEYHNEARRALVSIMPPVADVALDFSTFDPAEARTYAEALSVSTGFPVIGKLGIGHEALAIFDQAPSYSFTNRRIYECGVWWDEAELDLLCVEDKRVIAIRATSSQFDISVEPEVEGISLDKLFDTALDAFVAACRLNAEKFGNACHIEISPDVAANIPRTRPAHFTAAFAGSDWILERFK